MDNPLIGTWSLISWYNQQANGDKSYPLGTDASGYINYSPDGFVFVHLIAGARELYELNDPFAGTQQEDSAAIKSQISYAGPYEYHKEHVIHHVTAASCPNWVGSKQIRNICFKGPQLELSAAGAQMHGQRVTAHVLWERVSG